MLALLDLDGTLVDQDAGFRTWLAGFVAEHGLDDAGRAWLHAWDQEAKQRGAFFAGLVDHFGLAVHPHALWKQYRAVMPHVTPAFEGVQPGLVALARAAACAQSGSSTSHLLRGDTPVGLQPLTRRSKARRCADR